MSNFFFIEKHNQNKVKMFAFREWIDAERCVWNAQKKSEKFLFNFN